MSTDNNTRPMPVFAVGNRASREVQKALKNSKDPSATITNYQKSRSLHAQFAKAFGTKPRYEVEEEGRGWVNKDGMDNVSGSTGDGDRRRRGYRVNTNQSPSKYKADKEPQNSKKDDIDNVETLETDSILQFLSHLGLTKYQVHKKVGDVLQKQLEDELRKTTSEEPLLQLLQNCWPYAIANAEFRPILWSVLKQLGRRTPAVFLRAVAERKKTTGQLKYPEIFKPLPPLLKRLVWETDWIDRVGAEAENDPKTNSKQFRQWIESTMLYETVDPHIESYCTTEALVEASVKFFVHSTNERRIVTSHRRALITSSSVVGAAPVTTVASTATASKSMLGKIGPPSSTDATSAGIELLQSSTPSGPYSQSAQAVSNIRTMLSDSTGGSASYRPVLLHAILSILMAKHGSNRHDDLLLAGERHLVCTLVADVLLSTSGPLPKQYTFVRRLARILDDAVTRGLFTDKDLLEVQAALNEILQTESAVDAGTEDADTEMTSTSKKDENTSSDKKKKLQINISLIRQLNQIITNSLTQMKEEDANSIFLNTVTDAVAPGYSKLIKRPMSISQMEGKIDNNVYQDLDSWESDVKLMFSNCMKYNKGPQGAWFRGEAERQKKIFLDEILPQAKRNWTAEVSKRNPNEDNSVKRKHESKDGLMIEPFAPAQKIRKIEDTSEYQLSMVAVASMLLCDPFVVRILLDRILRSIRVDVLKGESVPAAHIVIPPIMQLLTLAQWSSKMCAVRGGRYFIPQSGLTLPKKVESMEDLVPYASLRRYMPVLVHLLLDADLEKRLVVGGELHAVANSLLPRPQPTQIKVDNNLSPISQVAVALAEGIFIQICLPGYSHDVSLASSFVKCSEVLLGLTGCDVINEKSFFRSLVPVILRHKRMKPSVRDVIIATWKNWLKAPSQDYRNKKKNLGPMSSAAHEHLILLLNEWSTVLGNALMPRDLLLEVATDIAKTVDAMEERVEDKMAAQWRLNGDNGFAPIKTQYERLLSLLPENHKTAWKKELGISSSNTNSDEVESTK